MKVGLGFFFTCLSLFSWLMVANNNFQVELGIVSSFLAFAMIYRSLEFIFNDANLIFQTPWDSKSKLPTDSMNGWDIRSHDLRKIPWQSNDLTKIVSPIFMALEQNKA